MNISGGWSKSDTFIIVLTIYTFHSTPWQNNSENIQQQKNLKIPIIFWTEHGEKIFLSALFGSRLTGPWMATALRSRISGPSSTSVPDMLFRRDLQLSAVQVGPTIISCSGGTCNYQLFRQGLHLSAVPAGFTIISCSGRTCTYLLFRRDLQLSAVQVGPATISCSGGTCNYQLFRWDLQLSAVQGGPVIFSCLRWRTFPNSSSVNMMNLVPLADYDGL